MKFFDLHCDTLTRCMDTGEQLFQNNGQNSLSMLLHFETPVQLFAVFTDDPYVSDAYNYAKRAVEYFYAQKEKYADNLYIYNNNAKQNAVGAILSIEGGEPIESLAALDEFSDLGIRLVTLTWNRVNKIGSGMTSGSTDGLTDFGRQVVKKMNEKNMIIDVSHLNIQGFKDVCALSGRPFIASHSNSYTLCPHPRNLRDWQIDELKACGGIIGLNMYPPFLSESGTADMYDILRHTAYFLDKGCKDILCLGCDMDGISHTPRDVENTGAMDKVYFAFCENFGREIADKIFFENAEAFLKSVN